MNQQSVQIGRVIRSRYVLEERLGGGATGTVFRAEDLYRSALAPARRFVAIKIRQVNDANDAAAAARLRREFYCAQMLSHAGVINVYEMDRDGELEFFTMELLEGDLLSDVLAQLKPAAMARPQAWTIIRDVGSAVVHAHSRNVFHADLKPHNILLTHSGEVRILDFGAAGDGQEEVADSNAACPPASSSYASCELLAGRSPDPRDDVYSLACIFYELLAGTHPFQRRRATEARDLGIVPKRPPGLSRQQWQALKMGLSWHRAARSISIQAWMNRLNAQQGAAQRLPGAGGVRPAPVHHAAGGAASTSLRATALFAMLLLTVGTWVSFVRLASGSRSMDDDSAPSATIPPAASSDPLAASDGGAEPAEGPRAGEREAPPAPSPPRALAARAQETGRPRGPPAPAPAQSTTMVFASNYTVRAGEHFAEIRVHRSPRLRDDAEFVWWTEAASAKPGIDYVHQGKVRQSFPKGRTSTSFFIKLVPQASRSRREVFYVAIAQAGRGASSDPVARAAVWLPTSLEHPQAAVHTPPAADEQVSTAALGLSLQDSRQ